MTDRKGESGGKARRGLACECAQFGNPPAPSRAPANFATREPPAESRWQDGSNERRTTKKKITRSARFALDSGAHCPSRNCQLSSSPARSWKVAGERRSTSTNYGNRRFEWQHAGSRAGSGATLLRWLREKNLANPPRVARGFTRGTRHSLSCGR